MTMKFVLVVCCTISLCEPLSSLLEGLRTHRVPLRRSEDDDSPYALAISSSFEVPPSSNFLATQVWPSARVAAAAVETYLDPSSVQAVCEFGCGPALPSLTAAKGGVPRVIATDVDLLALELVKQAATEQKLSMLTAHQFDLLGDMGHFPLADLYLFSDVFESSAVARGTAFLSSKLLARGGQVWVFAQSDRAQREIFLCEMRKLLARESLVWNSFESGPEPGSGLWLCDVDETKVDYS